MTPRRRGPCRGRWLGSNSPVPVLIDLEIGMGRTGIEPGEAAAESVELVDALPNLAADGLHAYDGQIHDTDIDERRKPARPGHGEGLGTPRNGCSTRGLPVPRLVLGGTPTFPIHAELDVPGVECSPGTIVAARPGYAARYPDLPFTPAALLLTRVISRPRPGRLCLDLGHKAVAADPTGAGLGSWTSPTPTSAAIARSTCRRDARTPTVPVGTPLLAIPTHICPTFALHRRVYVIEDGGLVDEWEVQVRDRVLGDLNGNETGRIDSPRDLDDHRVIELRDDGSLTHAVGTRCDWVAIALIRSSRLSSCRRRGDRRGGSPGLLEAPDAMGPELGRHPQPARSFMH